jgi:hypothetical protein
MRAETRYGAISLPKTLLRLYMKDMKDYAKILHF